MREQIIPGPFSSPAKNGLGTRLEIFLHIVYSSYTCGKFLAHFESVGSFLGELLKTGHPVLTCMLFGHSKTDDCMYTVMGKHICST